MHLTGKKKGFFFAVMVQRECSLVLLLKVGYREGKH
jgi:hypothetical protein